MDDSCNLCCKKLNGSAINLRNSKSKQSGIFLISLIENFVDNLEYLQNYVVICKECNELLLELEVLRFRLLEIQNIMKRYIEKSRHFMVYLPSRNLNETGKVKQEILKNQKTEMNNLELFEEIIEINCDSMKDDLTNDALRYSSSKSIEQNECIAKVVNERTTMKLESNKPKNEYKCHCAKHFRTKSELKKHLKTHTNDRPYVCEICGQAYRQKNAFDTHIKMHEGLNPFTCVYCNKSFTQKVALVRHVPMHTGEKPYQCEECGKRFTHHTSFSAHKLIHTGEKPYKCPHCNEAFRSSSHLTRHKRVHTGEKKFGCTICGKHFAERYNLVVHQKVHTNARANLLTKGKHFCQVCGESFERPTKLAEHKEKKHFSVNLVSLVPALNV